MGAPLWTLGPEAFRPLHEGWELAGTEPGLCPGPEALAAAGLAWRPATVPGTVAGSLDLPLEGDGTLDDRDWWFRTTFAGPEPGPLRRLRFEGLATLAEVWLNGERVLAADNMFLPRACDVTALLRERNELALCFRALAPALAARRPRPRWKTALVSHQNLRWVRTTLLGRIPGWTPPLPPVGPWRPLGIETLGPLHPTSLFLRPGAEGTLGRLHVDAAFTAPAGGPVTASLELGDRTFPLAASLEGGELRVRGDLELPGVPLWSPHTQGAPTLLPCALRLGPSLRIPCGSVGFRALAADLGASGPAFTINGRALFARGACWTAEDARNLDGDPGALRDLLVLARDAGLNMIRVGGTMTYASEALLDLCDELGILVWQDFMFANMDYPFDDPGFRAAAVEEAEHHLRRLARHPCVAAFCGGSEIEQQAAMTGLPPEAWCHPFLRDTLPALCRDILPGLPCFPSTPTGGALPFSTGTGLTHYYGVGAYLRDLRDPRLAGVRFTSECLGFSNVPGNETMERINGGARPVPHHPRWKAGVPRDQGAGWDFEDVRDHYLGTLFRLDPLALRYADLDRYWALSRLVPGELMLRVFAEWRRPGSPCAGALVWFLKDLRPGAGWGIVDSAGRPKAAYWFLKRAWAPRAVLVTDEGLDGLDLHIHNETPDPLDAVVELECLRDGRRASLASTPVQLPPFGARTLKGDALVGHFADLVHAYRFGPPKHDLVVARLRDAGGAMLFEDVFFPGSMDLPMERGANVELTAEVEGPGVIALDLASDAFLQGVSFECEGDRPDEDHFHLAPHSPRRVRFRTEPGRRDPFKVQVRAVNVREEWTVRSVRG